MVGDASGWEASVDEIKRAASEVEVPTLERGCEGPDGVTPATQTLSLLQVACKAHRVEIVKILIAADNAVHNCDIDVS